MPPKGYDDDWGYADDDPWGGEEGVGGGYWAMNDEGDKPGADDDDDPACDCDDCNPAPVDPAPKPNDDAMDDWVQQMADQADEDAAPPNPDAMMPVPDEMPDDGPIFDYTDCGGDGDRLTFETAFQNDALFVQINMDTVVILRDDQVNDLMSALLEWQERND